MVFHYTALKTLMIRIVSHFARQLPIDLRAIEENFRRKQYESSIIYICLMIIFLHSLPTTVVFQSISKKLILQIVQYNETFPINFPERTVVAGVFS